MAHVGVFIDPSEYRRNNLDFGGKRLTAFAEAGRSDWITFLQTDISISEMAALINDHLKSALDLLRGPKLSVLKSVNDTRMDVFRDPPDVGDLAAKLFAQFKGHLRDGQCNVLPVADVDSAKIFEAYFDKVPPFDSTSKKSEFPDAFTLQRLVMWAEEHDTTVYIVGPDDDLRRVCDVQDRLQLFEKIEALPDHINRADALVRKLHQKPKALIEWLEEFVRNKFPDRIFIPEYNPHGDVENVEVTDVEIGDVYALEVDDGSVKAEAEAIVKYSADVSYEDLNTGFYDNETNRYYMTDYVNLKVEETSVVNVLFDFSVDADDNPIVSDASIEETTIRVREEDRGDYGFYK
jgi:hypothetical protein